MFFLSILSANLDVNRLKYILFLGLLLIYLSLFCPFSPLSLKPEVQVNVTRQFIPFAQESQHFYNKKKATDKCRIGITSLFVVRILPNMYINILCE